MTERLQGRTCILWEPAFFISYIHISLHKQCTVVLIKQCYRSLDPTGPLIRH